MLAQPQPSAPPAPAPAPAPLSTPAQPPVLSRGWLRALLHGIHVTGVRPKDPRVRALWRLLRRRQLLGRSPWAQTRLRFIWQKGLDARPRPRTIARLLALLRNRVPVIAIPQQQPWARSPRRAVMARAPMRRLQPVVVRRVATVRPVAHRRPVRPHGTRPRGR